MGLNVVSAALRTSSPSLHSKEEVEASSLPLPLKQFPSLNAADIVETTAAVANGVPARASPSPNIPNGKPASPYVERSNPMGQGATQTVSSKDPKAAALAASDMRNVVRRKLTGYVGFANLPNQWHRKSVRKGFNFNVMVVGQYPISSPLPPLANHYRIQASRDLENQLLSILSSTPPFILQKNAKDLASTSSQKRYQSSRSVQTLRRVVYA